MKLNRDFDKLGLTLPELKEELREPLCSSLQIQQFLNLSGSMIHKRIKF